MTGDEDDGNVDTCLRQLALEVQPVDSRKSHVENKTAGCVRAFAEQEFLRRRKGLGAQANRLQHSLNGSTNQVIVIHDENGGGGGRHSRASTLMRRVKRKN